MHLCGAKFLNINPNDTDYGKWNESLIDKKRGYINN